MMTSGCLTRFISLKSNVVPEINHMGEADAAAPSSHTCTHTRFQQSGAGREKERKAHSSEKTRHVMMGEGAGLTDRQEQKRPMGENTKEKLQQKKPTCSDNDEEDE